MTVAAVDRSPRRSQEAFRGVCGQFTGGVALVIALRDGEPHATTASSFVAVSFEPPLLAVCFAAASRTARLLRDGERFTLSVLGENDQDIARRFARPDRPTGSSGLAGLDLTRRDPDPPVLGRAVAWLDCVVRAALPLGDHHCFVGEVLAAERDATARPLLYYRGRFHRLGPAAAPPGWAVVDRIDLAADW